MREYDLISDWYATQRITATGTPELGRLVTGLAPGARVLDAGCGNGIPISAWLIQRGFAVCGVDSSARMVAAFRRNLPQTPVECASILDSALFGGGFAAIVSWGVLFHLDAATQVQALARLGAALQIDGRLLFTAAAETGTRVGTMDGIEFRYESLGRAGYHDALNAAGCRVLDEFSDAGDNYYYLAQRARRD